MSGLKAIKNRIGSVKNTRKITRAMKMVAAARLKKAQDRITALRPYAIKTAELLGSVATSVGEGSELHPLLKRREEKNVLLVVMTSDRGLAGAFNASINKATYKLWKRLEEEGKNVEFATVGRKGNEFFRRRQANIVENFTNVLDNLNPQTGGEVGRYLIDRYGREEIDTAYVIYNEFVSPMTQIVRAEPVLPVQPAEIGDDGASSDPIFEPDREGLLSRLLPMYVETQCYRGLLESVASEHGARMTAMDNATRNASDMIDKLTLKYNRARQAAITKELMEIIGGAEALKG